MITATPSVSRTDIEAVLSKIRSLSTKTQTLGAPQSASVSSTGFHDIMSNLKTGLSAISNTQNETEALKQSYLKGSADVPLSQVLVSSARSKVAFEGLIAVRKLFVEAYKEVMNMPV